MILWVFGSLVVIEGIILVPSVFQRQRELLKQLEEVCAATTMALVPLMREATSDQEALEIVRSVKPQINTNLLGGTLYKQDGQQIGTFGEPPIVTASTLMKLQATDGLRSWQGQVQGMGTRFDVGIAYPLAEWNYILVLRYDLTPIHQEIRAYIIRIIGLVVIIAIFITASTMIGMQILIINPVLRLRDALKDAGESISSYDRQPTFRELPVSQQDELGEVSAAFNEAFRRITWEIMRRQETEMCLRDEQEKSERLLLNILPVKIVEQLKQQQLPQHQQHQQIIAERFDQVTILFADIVNFTQWASRVSAIDLVTLLNAIFSRFDQLAEHHGLEKIKTIGDAYMVVGGLPTPRPDHAAAIANMALDMLQAISEFQHDNSQPFCLRIGINTGTAVAGVIGIRKFTYDLWGDAVNIASRMESQGVVNQIQVTETTYECLRDRYEFAPRGTISVKGKGDMMTYLLLGKKGDGKPIPIDLENITCGWNASS